MPGKSTKKVDFNKLTFDDVLKGRRGVISIGCLLIEYYGPRTVAYLNDARVFLYEWGEEYTWDYYLDNEKAVDFRYALGGLYYDFVKYARRGKAWKKKKLT